MWPTATTDYTFDHLRQQLKYLKISTNTVLNTMCESNSIFCSFSPVSFHSVRNFYMVIMFTVACSILKIQSLIFIFLLKEMTRKSTCITHYHPVEVVRAIFCYFYLTHEASCISVRMYLHITYDMFHIVMHQIFILSYHGMYVYVSYIHHVHILFIYTIFISLVSLFIYTILMYIYYFFLQEFYD